MKVLGHLFDYFNANGVTTFKGVKTRIATNLIKKENK